MNDETDAQDPALQPPAALLMIKLAMAVAPAVCCTIGMLLLAAYRLDRATLAEARVSAVAVG